MSKSALHSNQPSAIFSPLAIGPRVDIGCDIDFVNHIIFSIYYVLSIKYWVFAPLIWTYCTPLYHILWILTLYFILLSHLLLHLSVTHLYFFRDTGFFSHKNEKEICFQIYNKTTLYVKYVSQFIIPHWSWAPGLIWNHRLIWEVIHIVPLLFSIYFI